MLIRRSKNIGQCWTSIDMKLMSYLTNIGFSVNTVKPSEEEISPVHKAPTAAG